MVPYLDPILDPITLDNSSSGGDPFALDLGSIGDGVLPPQTPDQIAQTQNTPVTAPDPAAAQTAGTVPGFDPSAAADNIAQQAPTIRPPSFARGLASAALNITAASNAKLPLGTALAAGVKGYEDSMDDQTSKQLEQQRQNLGEYEMLGRIKASQQAQSAYAKRMTALDHVRQTDPQLADLIDIDPAMATKVIAGKYGGTKYENVGGQLVEMTPGQPPKLVNLTGGTGVGATDANGKELSGKDFLSTLQPNFSKQVQAWAEGRMDLPSSRSPLYKQAIDAISQYDPSFDQINYKARAATRKAFTSGTEGRTANSLNTVIGHIGSLYDKIDGLNNGEYQIGNYVKNKAKEFTGNADITNFNTNSKAVADEVVKVWRASGGSVHDIEEAQNNLSSAKSPEQLKGALQTLTELLNSKLGALNDQYKKGMGTAAGQNGILTPHSIQTLKKFGLDKDMGLSEDAGTETGADAAPDLGSATPAAQVTTQAEFDALPKGAAFINPKDGKVKYKK